MKDGVACEVAPPSLATTSSRRAPGSVVTGNCLKNNLARTALWMVNCPTSQRYASFVTGFKIDKMTLIRRPLAFAAIVTLKCSGGLLAETSMASASPIRNWLQISHSN